MRYLYVDRNSITFAAPSDPTLTLRFSRAMQGKNVGKLKLRNVQNTIVRSGAFDAPKIVGCDTSCETAKDSFSIRMIISGSVENKTAMVAEIRQFLADLAVVEDDILLGFLPSPDTILPPVSTGE